MISRLAKWVMRTCSLLRWIDLCVHLLHRFSSVFVCSELRRAREEADRATWDAVAQASVEKVAASDLTGRRDHGAPVALTDIVFASSVVGRRRNSRLGGWKCVFKSPHMSGQ